MSRPLSVVPEICNFDVSPRLVNVFAGLRSICARLSILQILVQWIESCFLELIPGSQVGAWKSLGIRRSPLVGSPKCHGGLS